MNDAVVDARANLREAVKNHAAAEQLLRAHMALRDSVIEYHEAIGKTPQEAAAIYEEAGNTCLKLLEKSRADLAEAQLKLAESAPDPSKYSDR